MDHLDHHDDDDCGGEEEDGDDGNGSGSTCGSPSVRTKIYKKKLEQENWEIHLLCFTVPPAMFTWGRQILSNPR